MFSDGANFTWASKHGPDASPNGSFVWAETFGLRLAWPGPVCSTLVTWDEQSHGDHVPWSGNLVWTIRPPTHGSAEKGVVHVFLPKTISALTSLELVYTASYNRVFLVF